MDVPSHVIMSVCIRHLIVGLQGSHQTLNACFPGGSDGKESACNAGDPDSIPGSGRSPGEGNGYPLQYSCLEYLHGLNDLAGYNPWGHKESDTTE